MLLNILGDNNGALETGAKTIKYIIGTGWWCDGSGKHAGSIQKHIKSYDFIRQKEFFNIWYHFINKYTCPEKIIITGSDSPVRPDLPDDPRIEFVNLRKNFGHSVTSLKERTLCGADRAVLNGAMYAYLNDVDYYVYIEQDCLVRGEGWLNVCIDAMKKCKIMYGRGRGTPQPMGMEIIIIRNSFILEFISRYLKRWDRIFRTVSKGNWDKYSPETQLYLLFKKDFAYIPFGYGRNRPINFKDKYIYAQHWTEEELKEILAQEKIDLTSRNSRI